jgi:hypothetical protein
MIPLLLEIVVEPLIGEHLGVILFELLLEPALAFVVLVLPYHKTERASQQTD